MKQNILQTKQIKQTNNLKQKFSPGSAVSTDNAATLVGDFLSATSWKGVRIDADAAKILEESNGSDRNVMLSMAGNTEAAAARHGVTRKKLKMSLELQFSAVLFAWAFYLRSSLQSLVNEVKRVGGRLRTLFISLRFDETPTELTVVDDVEDVHAPDGFSEKEVKAWKTIVHR